MNETNQNPAEINPAELQRLRSVLKQITSLAKEASLTGSLEKGSRSAAQQYNRILKILQDKSVDLGGLFEPLAEDASFDEIGVTAAQLAGYIENEVQHGTVPVPPVPPMPPVPPVAPEQPHSVTSNFSIDMSSLKELDKLKGLGQMIREQLPEWIKQEVAAKMEAAHEHSKGEDKKKTVSGSDMAIVVTDQRTTAEETSDMESKHATQRLEENQTVNAGSNFRDMDMSGARFSDTNLAESAFSDVNFAKVEFADVNFADVVFADCNIGGARFNETNFGGARFNETNFGGATFNDSNFNGVAFSEVDMTGARFEEIRFANATFNELDMANTRFAEGSLAGASFSEVDMSNARFNEVNLSDARFSEVNLSNAHFSEVNFGNVELNECNVTGMKINGISVDELLRRYRQQ